MKFRQVKKYIIDKLVKELDPSLTYHGVHHSLDVLESALRIAKFEKITDDEEIFLLSTAALFHDVGFLKTYENHEEVSCEFAREILPLYDYSLAQIDKISELIMATMIPQSPKSHLGEILCDADLDYIGRDDFVPIGDTLFKELITFNKIQSEEQWNNIQISFIGKHKYFTSFSKKFRQPKKIENLEIIKEIVAGYDLS
ncbi:MAG: HD domain-containing protein [Bacteroidota bacterium]|nr:HD domain-containing protein [Bacteroidota bacterium]